MYYANSLQNMDISNSSNSGKNKDDKDKDKEDSSVDSDSDGEAPSKIADIAQFRRQSFGNAIGEREKSSLDRILRTESYRQGKDNSSQDVLNVFWHSNPELYYECVRILLVTIAFYMALWLTAILTLSKTPAWKIWSLVPVLICIWMYVYIIRTAAMLKAVHQVDADAILEVIEDNEGVHALAELLKNKILGLVDSTVNPQEELQRIFKEIDGNGSNFLTRNDFILFMDHLGLTFSRKKWKRIFREIDRNCDDKITFQEFFLFVFPDHDYALALETKRLNAITKRVFWRGTVLQAGSQHSYKT